MHDEPRMLCPHDVFNALPLSDLHLQEPRTGCPARTQIITDFLHAKKCITGRIWVLPLEKDARFNAPLQDVNGEPLTFLPSEESRPKERLTWLYHVAAWALAENQTLVVYDPAAYNGPVWAETWKKSFAGEPVEILALGQNEAPRFGWAGSCYSPELQQEHYLDNHQVAVLDLLKIKRMCEAPDYDNPAYRPVEVPRITDKLLTRRW